ncbi:MAG: hypothetical protein US53_C0001G0013 [Candidatus Woesebacteria bacterium GW2011_GWA1_37_7]|uniref:Glycosyltransferase RgtA/B/C/D-like domain-containing protein n=1 Tax=Candidatus Woesebacteria bacterium GW2011_GWA1_37_7 TaxID=1618545 RepID=A0A0G0H4G1_9BACT|nr:MAG: hypothetical protein US53_C0001G0013 [Candidatus Woesebacteria bacterium GW2011_GWA1_37_7]
MRFKELIVYYLTWRLLLFIILLIAISVVPLQVNFLGGGRVNYLLYPYLWSWANFDGEHFLAIARDGYKPLTYFFFPLYPVLIRSLANLFGSAFVGYAFSGLIISNLSFFIGLIGLIRLVRLDYSDNIVRTTLLLILLFPTSFYFGSLYSESLFFALSVWTFYFARREQWLFVGTLGGLAAITRLVGIALFPALLAELYVLQKNKKIKSGNLYLVKSLCAILLIPMTLLMYMFYIKTNTGDALDFLHNVAIYGQQRSSNLILLPQVFYRYIFKILPNINYSYFPVVFTTWLEFLTAVIFSLLVVFGLLAAVGKLNKVRIRLSYAVYLLVAFLIPTLSGSFSSLPRYVVILFPAFIILSLYLSKQSVIVRGSVYLLLFICLGIATSLFVRGYWIS